MNNIKRMRNERGFTLIELLVVIVILGILAAVVVFAVGGLNDKGEDSACKIDTRTIRTAQEAYFAQQPSPGDYATEQELVDEELLSELSDLHDVTGPVAAATNDSDYDIVSTAAGGCTDVPAAP